MELTQAEFARHVRSAMARLYDHAALQSSPLALGTATEQRGARDVQAGTGLRQRLLDAIEAIQPGPQVDEGARAWRQYQILQLRYVEARDATRVQRELALSKSQYYREHEAALDSLVTVLWERRGAAAGGEPLLGMGLESEAGSGQLIESGGAQAGSSRPLRRAVTRIGREPANEFVIPDSRVSRFHAEIRWFGGHYVLHDLGSKNGTFVDGERLTAPQILYSGAVITLADLVAPAYTFSATGSTITAVPEVWEPTAVSPADWHERGEMDRPRRPA
jgi:hypothetical protein